MIVKALILGAAERSGVKDGKPWNMKTVSFSDTENPAGGACEVSLDKDETIQPFLENRMKVVSMHIFQNGKYMNFGGFVAK